MKTRIQTARHPTRTRTKTLTRKSVRNVNVTTIREQKDGLHLKSLLVPIDFSETSAKALDYAVSLAKEFGSQIKLVHVVESPKVFNDDTKPIFQAWDKQLVQQAKLQLDELEQEKIDELIPATAEVRMGRAYQEICDAARSSKTDLIVISTHGFTGLKHLFLGSTAERVVRHAPCSVLVVRGPHGSNGRPELKPKRILVPTDFSKHSMQALDYAKNLAKQFQAEIQLSHVVPVYYPVTDEMTRDICILEAELQETGEKRLAHLVKTLSSKGVSVKTQVRKGRSATEITEAVKELNSDLVVISTHGLTGWDRVFLGSTTEEVVRHVSCPVLVVRGNQPKSE
jgi:nucleotide-binding universal stress UspA family protein